MGSPNLRSHPLANLFASFRSEGAGSRAASDDEGSQPLLPDGQKPRSRGPSRLGRLASTASEGADLLPRVSFADLPSIGPASSLLAHTIILSKTIIGAGAAALPRAFDMLGLLCAGGFLLLVAYMTHFTNEALALGTIATGHMSFPEVVRVLCGRSGSLLLLLSLVLRCAGLVIIYVIISADVLAGHEGSTGLVCDLMGPGAPAWCSSRPLMAGGVALLCMAPLVTPKRLASTAITSWLGMAAVLTWVGVTLYLVAAALLQGAAHALPLLPDADAFSGGSLEVTTQIVACLPVLATAYTCQMTIHHILRDMQPFTERRVTRMSAGAVGLCTAIFLSIALGSLTAFGPGIPADVLTQFNAAKLEPLVGAALARAFYVAVRLGFLLSVITIAPSQMAPYRESLSRLLAGRELSGAPYYLLTYASLALFFGVAMVSGSIWVPIQFVGATAGALIAFIFPALVALKAAPADGRPLAYWRWNAWALIVVGVVQAAAGVTATLFLQPSDGRNGGAALAAAVF